MNEPMQVSDQQCEPTVQRSGFDTFLYVLKVAAIIALVLGVMAFAAFLWLLNNFRM